MIFLNLEKSHLKNITEKKILFKFKGYKIFIPINKYEIFI